MCQNLENMLRWIFQGTLSVIYYIGNLPVFLLEHCKSNQFKFVFFNFITKQKNKIKSYDFETSAQLP